ATISPDTRATTTGGAHTTVICPTLTTSVANEHLVCMGAKASPTTGAWPASQADANANATFTARSSGCSSACNGSSITIGGYDADVAASGTTSGTLTLAGVSAGGKRGTGNMFGMLPDTTAPTSGS